MSNRIEIYDTTLRDGSQGEGVNFSVEDKCRIAEHLGALGVDFIEGGWPGSNPRVAPEKRPSVSRATSSPSPSPTSAAVTASISRIPGPPAGPS